MTKYDSALPDVVKEALSDHKAKVNINTKVVKELINQLHNYRRRRMLDEVARYINETQLQGDYDEDKLLEQVTDKITQARFKRETHKPMAMGTDSNYKRVLKRVLSGEALRVLPTGFSAWDDVNGGLVAKTVTLLKGFTGSMKSTLAEVIACNLADRGARVGQMSLEMSQEETLILRSARAARIPRDEILLAKNLTPKQKKKIAVAIAAIDENWKKIGSCVKTHTPPEGVTADELFLSMEAYGYDVLIVDYVALVKGIMSADNFWRLLMMFTGAAKQFATRTDTRVILLVQSTEENKTKLSTNMALDADLIWQIMYDEDFFESEFMDIKTEKARKQKPISFPLKKEGQFANICDCTEEETNQYKHDKEKGKIDVKTKRKDMGDGVEKIQTRGRKNRNVEEQEAEEYFSDAALNDANID
jgi:replicative DNA helicase